MDRSRLSALAGTAFIALVAIWIFSAHALPAGAGTKVLVPSPDGLQLADFDHTPDELKLFLANRGAAPITVAQVQIDAAYWDFTLSPGRTIPPGTAATLVVPYAWDQSAELTVNLVTSLGSIVAIGLSPENGVYRVPVKSWRLLTPLQLATLATLALGFTLLISSAGGRPIAIPLHWRDAATAALCSVIAWQIVRAIVGDAESATIRPDIWRGTTPLLIAAAIGYGATMALARTAARHRRHASATALTVGVFVSMTLHLAATGMTTADMAAKGQDDMILAALRELLLFLVVRAAIVAAATETPAPWTPSALAAGIAAAVVVTVAVPSSAPFLRSQIWGPMLTALALGADGFVIVTAWQSRAERLEAPTDLITIRNAITSAAAVGVWAAVSALL